MNWRNCWLIWNRRLSEEKAALESLLAGGTSDYEEITGASACFSQIKEELDLAELRWLELSCL